MITGIIDAGRKVGEILDWVVTQAATAVDALLREAVLAIRFVRKALDEALDWALKQGSALLEAIVKIAEDIGSRLRDVIDWAKAAGAKALEALGEVWARLKNWVSYILTWVAKDLIPGVVSVVKGLLKAGLAVVEVIVWGVGKAPARSSAVLQAALAFGVSMVELLVAIAQQPQNAGALFVQAMGDLGKTVKDILEPAFTLSDADKRYLVQSLKDAGTGLQECLDGLLEIVGGAIFTVVAVLLEVFGVFDLTPAERARPRRSTTTPCRWTTSSCSSARSWPGAQPTTPAAPPA